MILFHIFIEILIFLVLCVCGCFLEAKMSAQEYVIRKRI